MNNKEIEKQLIRLELDSFELSQKSIKCIQEEKFEEALSLSKEALRLKQEHMELCVRTGSERLLPIHKVMISLAERQIILLNLKLNSQASNT